MFITIEVEVRGLHFPPIHLRKRRIRYLRCNVGGLQKNYKQVLQKSIVRSIINKVGHVIYSIKMKQLSGVAWRLLAEQTFCCAITGGSGNTSSSCVNSWASSHVATRATTTTTTVQMCLYPALHSPHYGWENWGSVSPVTAHPDSNKVEFTSRSDPEPL